MSDSHGVDGALLAWIVTNVVDRNCVVGEGEDPQLPVSGLQDVETGPLPGTDCRLTVTVSIVVPIRGTVVMRTPGFVAAELGGPCSVGLGDCCPVGLGDCPPVGFGGCCPSVLEGCWPAGLGDC